MSQFENRALGDLSVSTAKIQNNAATGAKIRLDNEEFLRGRNVADNGDVDMWKVNTSDEIQAASSVQMFGNALLRVLEVTSDPGNDLKVMHEDSQAFTLHDSSTTTDYLKFTHPTAADRAVLAPFGLESIRFDSIAFSQANPVDGGTRFYSTDNSWDFLTIGNQSGPGARAIIAPMGEPDTSLRFDSALFDTSDMSSGGTRFYGLDSTTEFLVIGEAIGPNGAATVAAADSIDLRFDHQGSQGVMFYDRTTPQDYLRVEFDTNAKISSQGANGLLLQSAAQLNLQSQAGQDIWLIPASGVIDAGAGQIRNLLAGAAADHAVNYGQVILADGSNPFVAAQDMGGFQLTNLAAGTLATDAVNKGQLDSALLGLKPKAAVRAATTANITIATDLNSGDIIDGVTLADGDRVLVKDQGTTSQNGIYVVGATPARSTDFDSVTPIDEINGAMVPVEEGTANAGKIFVQSGALIATFPGDPVLFVFFNSVSNLVGGDGITISGINVSVDHDGEGLVFATGQLALELAGSTLSKSASGLQVAALGITNAEVSASAGIVYSKLDLTGGIVNADVDASAAIAYSKLNLATSVVLGDLATSAYAEIATPLTLVKRDAAGKIFSVGGDAGGALINNVLDPVSDQDAATKAYVDQADAAIGTPKKEQLALSAGDITATYKDSAFGAIPDSMRVLVITDSGQIVGEGIEGTDYSLSYPGGLTRIQFLAPWLVGGAQALTATDNLHLFYQKTV
jgi:hypothetical protein